MEIGVGTRALVTGASRGIGLATCEALGDRGVRLGMVARGREVLEQRAESVGGVAYPADVTDLKAIGEAAGAFVKDTGGIDLLVANAGLAHYAPFADQDFADVEEMVQVNVMGVLNTVSVVLPYMLDRAGGHIVIVSSGAGLRAFPGAAVYGATKAANRGFAQALRHELSGTGVSVTTMLPGEVKTDLHTHQMDRMPDWRDFDEAISAEEVAMALISGVRDDRREVFIPAKVRLLGINGIAPGLVDGLLRRARGGSAAPRRG